MEEIELKKNYRKLSEILVAKLSRYVLVLIFAIGIFDVICGNLGFFNIRNSYLIVTVFVCMAVFFVPSFITEILNKEIEKLPFVLCFLFPAAMGYLFTAITNTGVILFVIPLMIITLYNNKKYLLIMSGTSVLFSFISYCLKYFVQSSFGYVNRAFSEYIITLYIPCLMMLAIVSVICLVISTRFSELIDQMLLYTKKLEQKQEDIDQLLDSSGLLINAQSADLTSSMLPAIVHIIKNLLHTDEAIPYVVGLNEDKKWNIISDGGQYSYAEKGDHIHIGFKRKAYSFYYTQNKDDSELFMLDIESFAFPIYENSKLVGFVVFSIRLPAETRSSLMTAYGLLSKAVSNAILNNKVFSTQEELVMNLAEICEAKSEQTGQHVKRIAKYMEIFGNALGLEPFETKVVSIASMLHDVGKLTIPIEILDKPGKLTDEEYEIIKSHTKIGYDMLKNCSGIIMQRAAQMALQHHERWDGRGYNKIKGEDIDFYSRYVAVADVFDALASKRSYKRAWTNEEVRDEIVRCKGTQFCPDAVDKFVENFDKFVEVRNSMPDSE